VAPLVDDQSHQESEDDLRGDREGEEVVDAGDHEHVPGLVDRGLLGRVLERRDGGEHKEDERPEHHDEGDAGAEVAPRPPRPFRRGQPVQQVVKPIRVERQDRSLRAHVRRKETATAQPDHREPVGGDPE